MKKLLTSLFAVVALSACGGRLDEPGLGVDESDESDTQVQQLDALPVAPPVIPVDAVPLSIKADQTPVIEFDLSNGRIQARINAPDFARDHLYSVAHQRGGCGCR